ncbi:MAG: transposase family protein, partial [Actinobacteria bacterium]|nr:transposase family protein [Actinomycetota bacterium]
MAPDTMRVRLHLRLIRVLAVLVDTVDRLEIEVTSTRSWSRCPHCGFKTKTVHDRRRRKIRDLPVSGRRTTLVWVRRRFSCDNCDERHLEIHTEFEGGLTRRLARGLVADAKVMSIRAVMRRHGLDWHLIQNLVTAWSALVAEHRRSRRCRVLLVDETSMRKRHRYVTVI